MSKVVMISGASRGIGRSIAENLLEEGYRLSLGVRRPEDLSALQKDGQCEIFQYDAQDDETARNWVNQTSERFQRIDALVNNAGILRSVGFEDTPETDQDLEDLWRVNVRAPFHLIRSVLPRLKEQKNSKVVNICSLSGKRVTPLSVGYAMSKHAVLALTHGVRLKCWEDGVRATAICPGFVNTDMVSHVTSIAHEQMTQPKDVAELVRTVLALPPTASVAELYVNCRAESHF